MDEYAVEFLRLVDLRHTWWLIRRTEQVNSSKA